MDELELVAAEATGIAHGDITADFVAQLRPAVGTAVLDEEAVLLDPATGTTHLLDAPGTLVIRCLDGESTIGEIAADFADVLGVDLETVTSDILSLVRTLGAAGLVDGVARDSHAGHDHGRGQEGLPVGADLGAWEDWAELGEHDGPTLLVNWGTGCGFCTRIVDDLVAAREPLAAAGIRLQLVTLGTADALHEQVGDAPLPVLHVETTPSFFEGLGTPVAYLVGPDRTVLEPLALGAGQVPELAQRLGGQAS